MSKRKSLHVTIPEYIIEFIENKQKEEKRSTKSEVVEELLVYAMDRHIQNNVEEYGSRISQLEDAIHTILIETEIDYTFPNSNFSTRTNSNEIQISTKVINRLREIQKKMGNKSIEDTINEITDYVEENFTFHQSELDIKNK